MFLVKANKCWINSFSMPHCRADYSDADVRELLHGPMEEWRRMLEKNPDAEWRACLAQILQEVRQNPMGAPFEFMSKLLITAIDSRQSINWCFGSSFGTKTFNPTWQDGNTSSVYICPFSSWQQNSRCGKDGVYCFWW